MLKRYTFWFSAAILFQFLTAVIHTFWLLFRSAPADESERQLVSLMKSHELTTGMGLSPSYADVFTAMGLSFTLLLLFAGFVNGYLLVKQTEPNVMKGIVGVNAATFGAAFLIMVVFAFFTPVLFTGLIFVNMVMAYLTVPKIEVTI